MGESMELEEYKKEFEGLDKKIDESLKYFKEVVETHTKGLIFNNVFLRVQFGVNDDTDDIIHLRWSLKDVNTDEDLNFIAIQHKYPITLRSEKVIKVVVNQFLKDIHWLFLAAKDTDAINVQNGNIIKTASWETLKEKYGR